MSKFVVVFPTDQVEFNLSESQRTGFRKAVNVTVLKRNSEMRHKVRKLCYLSKFTQRVNGKTVKRQFVFRLFLKDINSTVGR